METTLLWCTVIFIGAVIIILLAGLYDYKLIIDKQGKEIDVLKESITNLFATAKSIDRSEKDIYTVLENHNDRFKLMDEKLKEISTDVDFCRGVLGIDKVSFGSLHTYYNSIITPVNQSKRLIALEKHLNIEYKSETKEGYVLRNVTPKEDAV